MDKNAIGTLTILALLIIGSCIVMMLPEEEEEEDEGEETTEVPDEGELELGMMVDETLVGSLGMNSFVAFSIAGPTQTACS